MAIARDEAEAVTAEVAFDSNSSSSSSSTSDKMRHNSNERMR